MIYRKFGNTGAEVSALGMGCMRFEDPADLDASAATVLHAFEKGVNYFDTAPFYSDDRSEEIVGRAVAEMKKSGRPFYIATKTGEAEPGKVRAQLERSLERLQVDAIDFYHVWCVLHPGTLAERQQHGLLDTFRDLRDEGLIRHISVSTHLSHAQIPDMLDEAGGLFESILLGLNAANFPMRLPGARAAHERGMGVVSMNTLGGGLFEAHPARFDFLRRDEQDTLLRAALRFNLSLPELDCALVGFRNPADVDSAVEAVENFEALAPGEMDRYQEQILGSFEDLCTQCNYCADCPEEIPVLRFMEAYNHRILNPGNPEAPVNHLKFYWGIPDPDTTLARCTSCGRCVEVCTQHLPILDRFEELRADKREVERRQAAKQD